MAVTLPALTEATPARFRALLTDWIGEHLDELTPDYAGHGTTDELLAHQRQVQRLLFDADLAPIVGRRLIAAGTAPRLIEL